MQLNRLNKIRLSSRLSLGLFFFFSLSACYKKDRLSSSTYDFSITPPATSVVKNGTVTLTATGQLNGQDISVNPTWEVSSATVGSLSSSIGPSVTFQANQLGDVIVTATHDGLTTTSQIAVVTYIPNTNTYDVYTDALAASGDIFTSRTFLSEVSTGYTPQGTKFQRGASAIANDFWGVTLTTTKSLTDFAAGTLKFSLRTNRTLTIAETFRIDVKDVPNASGSVTLASGSNGFNRLSTDWQEISIPASSFFGTIDESQVKVPFAIVVQGVLVGNPVTFDIDAIRWEK